MPAPPTRPDSRVIRRYALFQLPDVVLVVLALLLVEHWVPLSGWVWAAILGGWVLKDVLLFPVLWRAYDDRQPGHSYSLEGMSGTAQGRVDPEGQVRVRNELWRAELAPGARPVVAGEAVRVVDRRGLTLIVRAEADPAAAEPGE